MASGGSVTPHGKTEIKMKITPNDFGPFCVMDGQHDRNFRSGTYWITTPKDAFLVLHRLHGGSASESGQYWTAEQRPGNESFRFDMAIPQMWNSLQNETVLLVPRGVYIYEGFAAPQRHYQGGGWQVFVPRSVVNPLMSLQKLTASGGRTEAQKKQLLETVTKAQSAILNQWSRKRIERITSQAHNLALKGRLFSSLPGPVQKALRSSGSKTSGMSKEVLPRGTYKVHEERIRRLDGSFLTLSLSVRMEFVK